MNKINKIIFIVIALFVLIILAITAWYMLNKEITTNNPPPGENIVPSENTNIELSGTDNSKIITTNSETSFRVINQYTTEYFTSDKNLLIMFGSWCSHCQTELKDVEKIVNYYKSNENVNVILIAHEYKDTVADLTKMVEQDFNFGDIQIFIDLKRIIRLNIDPEANSVPISYVVDKNGKVLRKNDGAINLDIAKDMLK